MTTLQILVEGYAHPGANNSFHASPTTTLIYDGDKKVLVDPGTNKEALLKALSDQGLTVNDIDILYLTHYHPDHFLNIKLFPDHDLYDGGVLWKDDQEIFHSEKIPGTDITILPTPGHSPEHTSLIIETNEGVVCVAQDVFWWEDGKQKSDNLEELMKLKDPYATDLDALKESRKKVLELADWIIPGHGRMFKNPRK